MNNKGNLTDERPPLLPVIIGTGFGSGFWPWGPGTAGSVLATLIWAALAYGLGITGESLQSITFFLVIVSTILGTWATAQLQPYWGEDPSRVVIDEMAGVWIPLSLLTPLTAQGEVKDAWWWALVALVLFRFFDMVKPLGIKKLDNRQGAFYVMAGLAISAGHSPLRGSGSLRSGAWAICTCPTRCILPPSTSSISSSITIE